MSASSFLRRARIAGSAIVDIANWPDVLPLAARGEDVTEIRLRNGAVIAAPSENALWAHFSDVWYHMAYTKHCPIPADAIVLDVGANVGVFSLFAARYARQVFSLEPASSNFARLIENVRCAANIFPFHCACAAKDGQGILDLSQVPVAFSLKTSSSSGAEERVEVLSLETVLDRCQIAVCDYLKLDCEGSEFDIILDSRRSVFERVRRMVMEYHDHLSSQYSHHDLTRKLKGLGFRTKEYNPNGSYGMLAAIKY